MPSKQRDEYWDAVKGTLMLLVVFGHFLQIGLSRLGGGVSAHRGASVLNLRFGTVKIFAHFRTAL